MSRAWLTRPLLRNIGSILICASAILIAGIGLGFAWLSDGLVANIGVGDEIEFCRDRYGSENDADVVMPVLGIFLLPALLRLIWFGRHVRAIEFCLAPLLIWFSLGMLAAAGCGADMTLDQAYLLPWFHIIYISMGIFVGANVALCFVRWPQLIVP